jgi:zinc transport system permease protein
LLVLVAALIAVISRRLLLGCLLPDRLIGDRRPAVRYDLGFDLVVAVSLALAATVVGVMAAFAFVFIPARVAFRFAGNWQSVLAWSFLTGIAASVGSFALAVVFDQPHGPVLVAALLIAETGRWIAGRAG